MEQREGTFVTRDGLQLYEQSWQPDGEPRAVVLIVHGFGEHSGRYDHVARRLVDEGIAAYAYDQRGHGKSEGERAYVESFAHYLNDLGQVLDMVRARHPGVPLYLIGHSMGGGIVTLFLVTRRSDVDGVVLSGAATKQAGGAMRVIGPVVSGVAKLAPKLPVRQLDAAEVSRDPAVVESYVNDELVYHGPIRVGMAAAMGRAVRRIQEDAFLITVPVLIMHGTEDGLVDVDASRELFDAISSNDKVLKEYEGLYHEIFNEPEQEQVLNDLVNWLNGHIARTSSATPA